MVLSIADDRADTLGDVQLKGRANGECDAESGEAPQRLLPGRAITATRWPTSWLAVAALAITAMVLLVLSSGGVAGQSVQTSTSSVPPSSVPGSIPPTTAPLGELEDSGTVIGGDELPNAPSITAPLIPVPIGCTPPPPAHIVFIGEVVETDYRTARYRIDQVRSGSGAPFENDGEIDIRYGLDVQYLDVGESYLVGAIVDPVLGLLVSHISKPIEDFGGDEVIGLSETDADCPAYEDADVTLHPDGTNIDAPLLAPLDGVGPDLLGAITTPVLIAFGLIFALAAFRNGIRAAFRALFTEREYRQ